MWVFVVVVKAMLSLTVDIERLILNRQLTQVIIRVLLPVPVSELTIEFGFVEIGREVLVAMIIDVGVIEGSHLKGVNSVRCLELLVIEGVRGGS